MVLGLSVSHTLFALANIKSVQLAETEDGKPAARLSFKTPVSKIVTTDGNASTTNQQELVVVFVDLIDRAKFAAFLEPFVRPYLKHN